MSTAPDEALLAELSALEPALRARLAAAAFDPAWLVTRARALRDGTGAEHNRVSGPLRPPKANAIALLPSSKARDKLKKRGDSALREGALALCVLAGGMATRMGSVVKALVEIAPGAPSSTRAWPSSARSASAPAARSRSGS